VRPNGALAIRFGGARLDAAKPRIACGIADGQVEAVQARQERAAVMTALFSCLNASVGSNPLPSVLFRRSAVASRRFHHATVAAVTCTKGCFSGGCGGATRACCQQAVKSGGDFRQGGGLLQHRQS